MECVKGNALSNGVAYGKVFVYTEPEVKISTQKTAEVKKELRRFSDARQTVRRTLNNLKNKTENNEVIDAHISMVDDLIFEEMVEGYIMSVALDDNDEPIGYKFVRLGKMMEDIRHGVDPQTALDKNTGTYGRYAEAAKYIDPREE